MSYQAVTRLQQRKEDLIFIQVQQLKELVENVGIRKEVRSVVGTIQQKGCLNLLKHRTDLLLNLRCNRRWGISIQPTQNMSPVLIVL